MIATKHYEGGLSITATSLAEASGTVSWYCEVFREGAPLFNCVIPEADSATEAFALARARWENWKIAQRP